MGMHRPGKLACPLFNSLYFTDGALAKHFFFYLIPVAGSVPAVAVKSEALNGSLSSLIEESWPVCAGWKAAPNGCRHSFEDLKETKENNYGDSLGFQLAI